MFASIKEMTDAVKPAATVLSDRVAVTDAGAVSGGVVDELLRHLLDELFHAEASAGVSAGSSFFGRGA